VCSTSDPSRARRAADPHHWVAFPEAGEDEEICDACGARPGTHEAAGPCDVPDAGEDTPPEPWEFWPGGNPEIMPGFDRPAGGKEPA
jgi:hypothetical protein